MSLTQYLSEHLPNCQGTEKRHETLAEARAIFAANGRQLEDFEAIFVVVRDPYALEISRYNYLRLNHPIDRGKAQEVALLGDFKRYLREAPFFGHFPPRLDLYYHEAGYVPPNLIVMRHERLGEEVAQHVAPFSLPQRDARLPRINTTAKARFEDYYDSEAEELCFQRHRWFFEKGFYPRKEMPPDADGSEFKSKHEKSGQT